MLVKLTTFASIPSTVFHIFPSVIWLLCDTVSDNVYESLSSSNVTWFKTMTVTGFPYSVYCLSGHINLINQWGVLWSKTLLWWNVTSYPWSLDSQGVTWLRWINQHIMTYIIRLPNMSQKLAYNSKHKLKKKRVVCPLISKKSVTVQDVILHI